MSKTGPKYPAFEDCREGNSPLRVCVRAHVWKLFPSGRAEKVGRMVRGGCVK